MWSNFPRFRHGKFRVSNSVHVNRPFRVRLELESLERRLAPTCSLSGQAVNCDAGNDSLLLSYDLGPVKVYNNGTLLGTVSAPSLITVNGGGGFNSLTLWDHYSSVFDYSYTVTSSQVELSKYDVDYSNIQQLSLTPAKSDLTDIYIRGTPAEMFVDPDAGYPPSNTVIRVGNYSDTLDGIGKVTIYPGYAHQQALYVTDAGYAFGDTYTFTNKDLTVNGVPSFKLTYNDPFVKPDLTTSQGSDVVYLKSGTGSLASGSGDDKIYVGDNGNLATVDFYVNGGAGSDHVNAYNFNVTGTNYEINNGKYSTNSAVYVNSGRKIDTEDCESLSLSAGTGSDQINVRRTRTSTPVFLYANSGDDKITVGSVENTLDPIDGTVSVYGSGQTKGDHLTVNDQGSTAPHTYWITSTYVLRKGGPTINYNSIENLTVNKGPETGAGPDAGDTFNVESVAPEAAVEIFAGNATVNIGNASDSLDDLQGPLTINAQGGFVATHVYDQGTAPGLTYTIKNRVLTRSGAAPITLNGTGYLEVNGAIGGNLIDVEDLPPDLPTTINAGAGDDLIRMRGGPVASALSINGEGGTNRLGYSVYTTGVYINLKTGAGTDVTSFSGIQNLTGGQGNDIIIGDDNANSLIGQGGRDLLVGAGGEDALEGGGGEDLLIGGSTIYDEDDAELRDIRAAWTRDLPYRDRISLLSALLNPDTISDDESVNTLTGGAGLDWFFANPIDVVTDLEPGEVVTPV
jgi:hypothetical protein